MVSTFPMQPFFRQAHLTVDTSQAQKYFHEEDNPILDDNILDQSAVDSGLELSPPMDGSRRESFAVSSSLFSPKAEDWQAVDMQSVPSNNPFLEQHSNNPFMRVDQQQTTYGPQNHGWSLGQASGSCTPMQQFDGLPNDFEGNSSVFHRSIPMQTAFSNTGNQVTLFSNVGSNNQSVPASPQKDWMGQDLKHQSMAKRMRPNSPTIRSHNDLRRGDGIRKKNARFDIPAERNLSNIDHLISQSTDEQEIKELKQQKRLLRNRQAALDSRQRKKLHTERLEDEKKQYTAIISDLEEQLAEMRLERDGMMKQMASYQGVIDSLSMEKEEMVRNRTIETGELRKKVSVLTDHVQRLESAGAPNATNFNNGFPDMESLSMEAPWESMNFMNDFPMEAEVKQEPQMVTARKTEVNLPSDPEKPAAQGGLLFMLFLVGAFVLSKRSVSNLPPVTEDVRAASATILENVFKDAGVGQNPQGVLAAAVPQPSGNTWLANAGSMHASNVHAVAPSTLGELTDSLTQPTQDQTNEHIFSMTPAQYNGVNSQDFLQNAPERSTSQGRRNLADALAAMRSNSKESAAEVYTRSLLWDQIPSEVVRNFAQAVADCNSRNSQHCYESNT